MKGEQPAVVITAFYRGKEQGKLYSHTRMHRKKTRVRPKLN